MQRNRQELTRLAADHAPAQIAQRLANKPLRRLAADAVLDGIDGCVASFAIVSAAYGAGLGAKTTVALGAASLVADGFSMGVSNYQSVTTERDQCRRLQRDESRHIDMVPEGEREEVRQIYAAKGLTGTLLEQVVDVITSDRETWIQTMLREEHRLTDSVGNAGRAATTTFLSFVLFGALPLLPYCTADADVGTAFV